MSYRAHSLEDNSVAPTNKLSMLLAKTASSQHDVVRTSQENCVALTVSPAIMIALGRTKLLFLLSCMTMPVSARSSAPAATTTRRFGHGGDLLWYNDILQATVLEDSPLPLQNQLDQEYSLYHGGDIIWKSPVTSRQQRIRHVAVTAEDSATETNNGVESETSNFGDAGEAAKSRIRDTNEVSPSSMGVYDCPDAPGSAGFLYWEDLINAIEDDSAGGLNTVFMLCPTVFAADQPLNIKANNIEIGCVTVTGCNIQNATVFVGNQVDNIVLAGLEFSNQKEELMIGQGTNVRLIACTFRGALFSGMDNQRAAVVTAGRTLFLGCHFESNLGEGAVFVVGGKPFFESCRFVSNRAVNDNSGASAIALRTANERTSQVSIRNSCFDENQGHYIVFVKGSNSKVILNRNNAIANSLGDATCQGIYSAKRSSCEDFDLIDTSCSALFSSMTTNSPAIATPLTISPASSPPSEAPSSYGTGNVTVSDETPWTNETSSVGTTNDDTRGRGSLPQDIAGDPPERDVFPEKKNPQPEETESADPLDEALEEYNNSDGILSIESYSSNGPNLLGTLLLTIASAAVVIFRS